MIPCSTQRNGALNCHALWVSSKSQPKFSSKIGPEDSLKITQQFNYTFRMSLTALNLCKPYDVAVVISRAFENCVKCVPLLNGMSSYS